VFSGRNVNQIPVETSDHILNGNGLQAGLKQMIDELADESLENFASKEIKRSDWDLNGLNEFLSNRLGGPPRHLLSKWSSCWIHCYKLRH